MAPSIVSEESRRDARRFFSGILLLLGFVVAGFFLLLLDEEGATSAPDVEVEEYPFEELLGVLLAAAFRLLALFLFFLVLLGLGIILTLPLCPGTGPRRLAGE